MFGNLKVTGKILVGFMLIACFSVITGGMGIRGINQAEKKAGDVYLQNTYALSILTDVLFDMQQTRVATRDVLLAESNAEAQKAIAEVHERLASIRGQSPNYQKTYIDDADKAAWEKFLSLLQSYQEHFSKLEAMVLSGKKEEAAKLLQGDLQRAGAALTDHANKLADFNVEAAKKSAEESSADAQASVATVYGAMAVGLGLAVVLALWIASLIARPLRRATELAASGDISTRLNVSTRDEIGDLARAFDDLAERLEQKTHEAQAIAKGDLTIDVAAASGHDQLGNAFKQMVEELQSLIRQIHEAFGQVASGSQEISDAAQSLSQGATEQASSLEEISSSMTEIGSQAKASAENAGEANRLVATAREAAERGDKEMKAMVSAMNEINTSSQQIAKIIKAIDDIAFQTNLLALNAAVEAARAGKHGKGFAVVAEEVRNLAGRSAKAARETAELIESSGKKVENGLAVARTTSEAFGQIVENVVKTADVVGEIAAASSEQAQGIAQATQGLSQIDQVTQRNTASAEETASASKELASNATHVRQLLRRFQVKGMDASDETMPSPTRGTKQPVRQLARHKGANGKANGSWGSPPALPEDALSLEDTDFDQH
ncbi:MAG: MCP four helix bundle domain-containing protein [Deltaproteobacteria bacterium]|nr:MCP four helix bundle domain-containing protein [Deltaproteobacteria bacterium]